MHEKENVKRKETLLTVHYARFHETKHESVNREQKQ